MMQLRSNGGDATHVAYTITLSQLDELQEHTVSRLLVS